MTMPNPRPAASAVACLCVGIVLGAHDSIHVERLLRALASAYTLHGAAVALGVAAWRRWAIDTERLSVDRYRVYDQGRTDGFRAGLETAHPTPPREERG